MGISYVFPNYREINPSSYDEVVDLIEKGLVQLNTSRAYGLETAECRQRLCFASPTERHKEGFRKIRAALEEL